MARTRPDVSQSWEKAASAGCSAVGGVDIALLLARGADARPTDAG
jgi:hypothetical protein